MSAAVGAAISRMPSAVTSRISPLDADQLVRDSQVRRALDILISYDIFDKMNNG